MGRARIHPVGTTATGRVNASVVKLKQAGGARKTWRLSPEAHSALRTIVTATHAATETEIIEWLLLERAAELRQSGSGSNAAASDPDRIYLYVPFKERHQAEEAGALWDRTVSKWYVIDMTDSRAVDRWRVPATLADAKRVFAAECRAAGLLLSAGPVLDGQWHRCWVVGDRKNEPRGTYRGTFEAGEGRGFGIILNSKCAALSRSWCFDGGGPLLPPQPKKKTGQVKTKANPAQTKPTAIPLEASLPNLSREEWEALLSAHIDLSAITPTTKGKAKAGG